MKNLTQKQSARFAAVEAKLPAGYTYYLHDEGNNHTVWGVSVYKDDESVAYASKPNRWGVVDGLTACPDEERAIARRLLNRATAALWHRQPTWLTAA